MSFVTTTFYPTNQYFNIKSKPTAIHIYTIAGSSTAIDDITTISSGDGGLDVSALLNTPYDVWCTSPKSYKTFGNACYISEFNSCRVRRIDGVTKIISTVIGNAGICDSSGDSHESGSAIFASVNRPAGLFGDNNGTLYIVETNGNRIRMYDMIAETLNAFQVSPSNILAFSGPTFVTGGSTYLLVADTNNHVVKHIDVITKVVVIYAGNGIAGFAGDNGDATSANFN